MTSTMNANDWSTSEKRSYHNTNAKYSLPNDNAEHARLEEQAERLRELMNHQIIHAPLDAQSARKALDIGCGTGTITHDIATRFNNAQVYGLDLSTVPLVREKLPNIEYVQGNIMELSNDPRFEVASFDLIFSRLLIAGMTDWKGYVERCVALTKPGGWVEMHDLDFSYHSIPPDLTSSQRESIRPHTFPYPIPAHPADSWLTSVPWVTTYQRLFQAAGMDATCGRQLPRWFHEAGLQDVQITRYAYPLGNWEGYTDAERRVGDYHRKTMGAHMPTLMRKVGSRQDVVSQEETEQGANGAWKSYEESDKEPAFCWMYAVCGRKQKM